METPQTVEEAERLLEKKREEIRALETKCAQAEISSRKSECMGPIRESLEAEGCLKPDVLCRVIDKDDVLRDVDGVFFPFLDDAQADADDVARFYRSQVPELFKPRSVDASQSPDQNFLDELADLR